VVTASGKESLGYNGSFLSWCVNNAVVDGGKQVTPDKPRAELPLVKLSFRNEQTGVHQSGAVTLVETDALDHDGSVSWAGAPPSGGVGYR
jgi:hypothetical protein